MRPMDRSLPAGLEHARIYDFGNVLDQNVQQGSWAVVKERFALGLPGHIETEKES